MLSTTVLLLARLGHDVARITGRPPASPAVPRGLACLTQRRRTGEGATAGGGKPRAASANLDRTGEAVTLLQRKPAQDSSDQPSKLSVQTFSRPYAPFHDRYQKYYREGLRRYCEAVRGEFELVHLARLPRLLAALRKARDAEYYERLHLPSGVARFVDRLALRLHGPITTPSGVFQMSTGQYVITTRQGRRYAVCIDTADSHEIQSAELCEWSDVYFKTNFWTSVAYPTNVSPLVNADPLVLKRLDRFRSRRAAPKEYDLCAVIRIWAGEGVEHNIRLLKAIASAKCAKFVLAVLFPGEDDHILRYLRQARVPATTRGLKPDDLWWRTAKSTLNVIRLGVHYCIPWRMTGSLCLGSCLVLDRPPLSAWPQPLLEAVNYLSLGLDVTPGAPVAPQHQYDAVPGLIEHWLGEPDVINGIAKSNAEYFDRFLEPQRVGGHIVQVVEELERQTALDESSTSTTKRPSPQA